MSKKNDENLKINKKVGIIWMIIIVLFVVGGQIAFFIALSML